MLASSFCYLYTIKYIAIEIHLFSIPIIIIKTIIILDHHAVHVLYNLTVLLEYIIMITIISTNIVPLANIGKCKLLLCSVLWYICL